MAMRRFKVRLAHRKGVLEEWQEVSEMLYVKMTPILLTLIPILGTLRKPPFAMCHMQSIVPSGLMKVA
jgi:hypothetical protein